MNGKREFTKASELYDVERRRRIEPEDDGAREDPTPDAGEVPDVETVPLGDLVDAEELPTLLEGER